MEWDDGIFEKRSSMRKTFLLVLGLGLMFFLGGCEDACSDVICANGGTCLAGDCSCTEGWTGDHCTEPIETVTAGCDDVSTITFDGYSYDLVQIGSQCWFAENLRSDNYRNGDAIPGELSDAQWGSVDSGAQAVYANDPANLTNYGRLYNAYAVNDVRGLCPTGWHVPTDEEWMALEMALGMSEADASGWKTRGSDEGLKLKSSPNDSPSWDGWNSSNFSGLPTGGRDFFGNYFNEGIFGYWWSLSSESEATAFRALGSGGGSIIRLTTSEQDGLAVRCLRD